MKLLKGFETPLENTVDVKGDTDETVEKELEKSNWLKKIL